MIEIQKIDFPNDCKIVKHEFYTYDPVLNFNENDNLYYLTENLLQCTFEKKNVTIDLGWYGETTLNQGMFKIYIIENENWENPLEIFNSMSVKEIKFQLKDSLLKYSEINKTEANNI